MRDRRAVRPGPRREHARGSGRAPAPVSGAPGHIRARAGRGWALVGDAAFFKDPATAHGITDALLDAHHLSGLLGRDGGPERYRHDRHAHAVGLFETTQKIASFDWDFEELKTLHATLNDCLKREQAALGTSAPDGPAEAPAVNAAARPTHEWWWPQPPARAMELGDA